jgi:hypothetical protein
MSTNKLVCQLCAEFIPATRAAKQNHRLTVGQPQITKNELPINRQ